MAGTTTKLLAEQRKRMLASIMRFAEQETWWGLLSKEEQERYRTNVVNAINVFYDFCRDVIKVSEDEGITSDASLKLLNQMHASQRAIETHLRQTARGA